MDRRHFIRTTTTAILGYPVVKQISARAEDQRVGKLHIVNVVHTEANWWDDGYTGLDVGTQDLLDRFEGIKASKSMELPITWCLFFANGYVNEPTGRIHPDIVDTRGEFFEKRLRLGDEIGIHTHAKNKEDQWKYIEGNAKKLEAAGFPDPRTHAPGWFYLDGNTLRALEKAEIPIDAGVIVRSPEAEAAGRDYSDHKSFQPYHPSYENIYVPGSSPTLELPLFLSYNGIEESWENFARLVRAACDGRNEADEIVLQFFWHPFEMLHPNGELNREVINGYVSLYDEVAGWEGVVFSTAYEAVTKWHDADRESE